MNQHIRTDLVVLRLKILTKLLEYAIKKLTLQERICSLHTRDSLHTREYAVERISGSQKFVSQCYCARTESDDPSTDAMFDGHVTTWETSS